jgi:hypothetical protein
MLEPSHEPGCQSALDWDPLSASKRDPFERRVRPVALASRAASRAAPQRQPRSPRRRRGRPSRGPRSAGSAGAEGRRDRRRDATRPHLARRGVEDATDRLSAAEADLRVAEDELRQVRSDVERGDIVVRDCVGRVVCGRLNLKAPDSDGDTYYFSHWRKAASVACACCSSCMRGRWI